MSVLWPGCLMWCFLCGMTRKWRSELVVTSTCWANSESSYDMATLAEALEVGVWGSKKSAPYPEAREFGEAIEQVLLSSKMAMRTKELADLVEQKGSGRDRAVEAIVRILAED